MPLPHNAVDFLLLICGKWLGQEFGQHRLHRDVQSTCHDLTRLLCNCVFSRLADTLITRKSVAHDWKRVCEIFSLCIQWTYPVNGKSRRVCPHIEAMLCLFCISRTILWLFKNASTKRGVEVHRLLKPDFIHLFHVSSHPPCTNTAHDFLSLQRQAIFPTGSTDFCMYQWFCEHFRYTGIAQIQRPSAPNTAGPAKRLHEHLLLTVRRNYSESAKLRYRLARRHPLDLCCFLVTMVNSEPRVRACEWFDIKTHCPNANGVPPKKGRNRSRVPRQRPCPHLREKKAVVTSVFEQDCTSLRLEKLTASFHRRMLLDERQSTEDTSVPFSRMYLDTLRSNFALTGVPGPLDIFLPEHRRLCAKWLITARHVDWEMVEQKCKTQFLAPKLAGLKSLLHKKAQKALLEKRLRQYLFWKQLPARRIHAKAPDATCRDALRAVVFRCINTCSSWTTSEKHWIRSQVRIHTGKTMSFKGLWNHVRCARSASTSVVSETSTSFKREVLLGKKMRKSEENWDVLVRPSKTERCEAICKAAVDAMKPVCTLPSRACVTSTAKVTLERSTAYCREARRNQLSQREYSEYTKDMSFSAKHLAVVPDDKERKHAWYLTPGAYQLLCILFVLTAKTWCFLSTSCAHANNLVVRRVLHMLGPGLSTRLGISPCTWLLPYVYCTIKSKCFLSGCKSVRICKEIGHSCARKICSYVKWPRRIVWKRIHRSAELLVKEMRPGAETWGLRDAAKRLKDGLAFLQVGENPNLCARCCCRKNALTVVVADAGQFYEEVSSEKACFALSNIVLEARLAGWTHVAVGRRKRRRAFLSTKPGGQNSAYFWFSLEDILRAFFGAMCVSLVSVGHLVAQMQGLPIGGLMSKVATSAVLATEEEDWLKNQARRFAHGFPFSDRSWPSCCLHLRYVDDVLLASRLLCRNCMCELLPIAYCVNFKVAAPDRFVTWLDMVVDCFTGEIFPKPRKFSTPPPWGTYPVLLRSLILGALLRAAEVSSTDRAVRIYMMNILVGLLEIGWSKRQICQVLFTISRPHLKQHIWFLRKAIRSREFLQFAKK